MQEFVVEVMNRFGYMGICFLITVENLFPPIPSEIILPFGGFMTTYTNMSVWGVIFFSTIGSTVGALILYRLGACFTMQKLERALNTKACKILGFKMEEVQKTVVWFEKKGRKAVLFGRCVPIIRSLVSIPAGMAGMELTTFLVYTVAGSTIWNLLLVSLGAALGASWGIVQEWLSGYSQATKLLLWVGIAFWIMRIIGKRVASQSRKRQINRH